MNIAINNHRCNSTLIARWKESLLSGKTPRYLERPLSIWKDLSCLLLGVSWLDTKGSFLLAIRSTKAIGGTVNTAILGNFHMDPSEDGLSLGSFPGTSLMVCTVCNTIQVDGQLPVHINPKVAILLNFTSIQDSQSNQQRSRVVAVVFNAGGSTVARRALLIHFPPTSRSGARPPSSHGGRRPNIAHCNRVFQQK